MRGVRKIFFSQKKKRAQVWVETVVYTLIGITIMGILIAATAPRIEKMKDSALIEQSIGSLEDINKVIYGTYTSGTGNQRSINIDIGKGKLIIDASNDKIYWEMESSFEYSQSGISTSAGIVNVTTTGSNPWTINLGITLPMNITYNEELIKKEFGESPTPYKLIIKNEGVTNGETTINIREVA
jgi:type II secretory pathway pseudopilin PulG